MKVSAKRKRAIEGVIHSRMRAARGSIQLPVYTLVSQRDFILAQAANRIYEDVIKILEEKS